MKKILWVMLVGLLLVGCSNNGSTGLTAPIILSSFTPTVVIPTSTYTHTKTCTPTATVTCTATATKTVTITRTATVTPTHYIKTATITIIARDLSCYGGISGLPILTTTTATLLSNVQISLLDTSCAWSGARTVTYFPGKETVTYSFQVTQFAGPGVLQLELYVDGVLKGQSVYDSIDDLPTIPLTTILY